MISRVKPSKTLCSDKRKAGPDLESIDKKIGVTKRFNNGIMSKDFCLYVSGVLINFWWKLVLKSRL